MKAIVTGGAGFIGSHLVDTLLKENIDVYDFIIRQPEFNWEIVPELDIINIITGQMQNFEVVYTPTGVTID